MPTPATGPLRLARGGVVAVVTIALAALAHVLAGGKLPPFVVLGTLAAIVLAAAVVLVGRRLGPVGAVALLGLGQAAAHSTFSLFTAVTCVPTDSAALVGHQHHAGMDMSSTCTAVDPGLVQPMLDGSAMLVLHVVATLAVALVLVGADRALWWLAAWLSPLAGAPVPAVLVARPALPTAVDAPWSPHAWWRDVAPRRGPPAWQSRTAPPR